MHTLRIPLLTGMYVVVSVLGTVGCGYFLNTIWIINNFLLSSMNKQEVSYNKDNATKIGRIVITVQ